MEISTAILSSPQRVEISSFQSVRAKPSLSSKSGVDPFTRRSYNRYPFAQSLSLTPSSRFRIYCGMRELKERIQTVKNTKKITEAMKLVSAAKVRRAQEAVINGRPFSRALVEMLYNINQAALLDDVETPLTTVRTVEKVALVVVTGDRGLCGSFNNAIIRKAEARMVELRKQGVESCVISVGKKGNQYFSRRCDYIQVEKLINVKAFPTAKDAQSIADEIFSLFVTEQVDKVEVLYTKFVSFLKSDPVIHTLLPLSNKGEVVDASGRSVDALDDEFFRLTTKEGKLALEREKLRSGGRENEAVAFEGVLEFEQDPAQIVDALMPLYLNCQILRALQESLASELAARMNAMSSATDNADELNESLSMQYNRERQAKITNEILEIVAGAEGLRSI